ncbi:hypothetical protein AYR62_14010 [Secundilactobacillus paracollinoides]|uniref:Uncharacterized protein n=1 Tax=Secundilactobacillus paracollinoides TaxID=240427 RepID=A0A1B2IWZ4_9LACO|nr:hypothetical protein [Secundilactobacillus paracollinoides]ANZ60706.1 hypothetical protein AYR61_04700 [Secundilactobacillus paracollinoides]ANZ65081.1 hypothetical protein AYR62_14010 [Secundilactobacillus paracollinoides]ANZ66549.1 hypothetical protein AYR63_04985 [Secundilactobacillus paracollinoides]
MASWFSRVNKFDAGDGSLRSHELDYGALYTAYAHDKANHLNQQREQAKKVSAQMKKDQEK